MLRINEARQLDGLTALRDAKNDDEDAAIDRIALCPPGVKLASVSLGKQVAIKVWAVPAGAALHTLTEHPHTVVITAIQFAQGEEVLICSYPNGSLRVLSVTTGSMLQTIGAHLMAVSSVCCSLDWALNVLSWC